MTPTSQETPSAELLEALHDLVVSAATSPRAAQPARLERAVQRWSRDLASPSDAVALVALARPQLATSPLRAELLDTVAQLAVMEIAQRQVSAALTDPLTGLGTRARMAEEVQHLLAVSRRTGCPLTAVVLDVDGLKQINDQHGHAAGDAALAEVGRAVRAHLRQADRAYRWGGDEFVLFLPGTTEAEARLVVDRIQSGCSTSTSAGLALHTDGTSDVDVATWLSKADADLYRGRHETRAAVAPSLGHRAGLGNAVLLGVLVLGAATLGWTGATVAGVTGGAPSAPAHVQAAPQLSPPAGGLAPTLVLAPHRTAATSAPVSTASEPAAAPAQAPVEAAAPVTSVIQPVVLPAVPALTVAVPTVAVPTVPAAPLPAQGVQGVVEGLLDTVQGVVSAVL